ncbi:MAG TPA: FAD-binding oxidoreductase [Thermomicrobiales bacterium]|nr:FAD-binding oxidoreductase [Thermomicrobiales bacterium]
MGQDVIVIGGGISGAATAYELARRGVPVTLIERGDLASMASGWTLAGVRQSGRHPAELPLAQAAVARWPRLADELGADVKYRQHGNLRLARTDDEVPAIRQVVADGVAAGIPMELIEGSAAVREVAPALTPDIRAASYCPSDGHANPTRTVRAFAAAAQRLGATIRTQTEVTGIAVEHGRVRGVRTTADTLPAEVVVVAAGIYTPRLLDPLGLELPLTVTLVPMVQTTVVPETLLPVLGVADGGFAGRQEASGRFRLCGATRVWDGTRHTDENVMPSLGQIRRTIADAVTTIPALADVRIQRVWGGLIDRTPDVIPVLERLPDVEGLVVGAGFSGHGFCLGPVTGEILADLATTGTTAHPIVPFARGRFAGRAQEAAALQMHG